MQCFLPATVAGIIVQAIALLLCCPGERPSELLRRLWPDRVRPCNQMQEALAGKANVSAVDGLLHRLEEQLQRNRFQDDLGGQLSQLRDEMRAKAAMSEVIIANSAWISLPKPPQRVFRPYKSLQGPILSAHYPVVHSYKRHQDQVMVSDKRLPSLALSACQIDGLLDKKANIHDVNNALAEVSNELEKKAAISGLEALMKQQVSSRGTDWGTGHRRGAYQRAAPSMVPPGQHAVARECRRIHGQVDMEERPHKGWRRGALEHPDRQHGPHQPAMGPRQARHRHRRPWTLRGDCLIARNRSRPPPPLGMREVRKLVRE